MPSMARDTRLLVVLAAAGSALLTAGHFWAAPGAAPGPRPAPAPAESPNRELRRLRGENERLRRENAVARQALEGATLWEGIAVEGASPRWFEPPLARASGPVRTIRVVLDTNRIGGWNEIDAVELVGGGEGQWAQVARASSSYADP